MEVHGRAPLIPARCAVGADSPLVKHRDVRLRPQLGQDHDGGGQSRRGVRQGQGSTVGYREWGGAPSVRVWRAAAFDPKRVSTALKSDHVVIDLELGEGEKPQPSTPATLGTGTCGSTPSTTPDRLFDYSIPRFIDWMGPTRAIGHSSNRVFAGVSSSPVARLSGKPKRRFPWLMLILLLASVYAFWILPLQLGTTRRSRVCGPAQASRTHERRHHRILPSGKSTFYRAAARGLAKGDVTAVPVPDDRFDAIVAQVKPKKQTPRRSSSTTTSSPPAARAKSSANASSTKPRRPTSSSTSCAGSTARPPLLRRSRPPARQGEHRRRARPRRPPDRREPPRAPAEIPDRQAVRSPV